MTLTHRFSGLSARWLATLLLFTGGNAAVLAAEAKFEAQLIWAANDVSNDPQLKAVDAETLKKLSNLPLKWKHYYLVNHKNFTITAGGTNTVVMSEKCTLEVKRQGESKVEVALHGQKGDVCAKRRQPLPKGEMLVLGGNAPNATGWLVTMKRVD